MAEWLALRASERSPEAHRHLAEFSREDYPELWAGTVQDGVARGFLVRLEEACSLAPPEAESTPEELIRASATAGKEFTGKELRRKKDILVASGGSRVRFSRKGGLLFVDRDHDINSENCLWFEARRDLGTLDGFAGADDERARLFSAQFLKPQRFVQSKQFSQLELAGRLGRTSVGWQCRIVITGHADAPNLHVSIELRNNVPNWRLRSRFLGVPGDLVHHHCMPVREVVTTDSGGFVADTLVRSCSTLLVDDQPVAVPGATSPQAIRHIFSLGIRHV